LYANTFLNSLTLDLNPYINCPDLTTSWSVLNEIVAIATTLESFTKSAKIRISPPVNKGEPFEIQVDELDIYKE
jgi:hypothetical protein